ncbi:MAG: O-antigen ligase family protein [Acinetobacter baumannii]|nr:O-antigen ligase family protein [Acinetobacter baumannii]HBI9051305.1 O-antigen ligase family protein [Acinetobacter baumannii]HBI9053918.1 O-antigen ligase family protein [Acinetobacter baumannii]
MMVKKNNLLLGFIVIFISFFTYSGYYAGLGILLEVLGNSASRLYSIPVRLLYCVFCLIFVFYMSAIYFKSNFKVKKNIVFLFCSTVLFLLYLFFQYLININGNITTDKSYEVAFYLVAYAIFPFLFYSVINYNKYKKMITYVSIISGFILGVISIVLYHDILGSSVGRISALRYEGVDNFISPLSLSYSASLTMTLSIFYWLNSQPKKIMKIFLSFCVAVSLFVFLLGASRGSLLTIFACFLIYFVTFNIKKLIMGASAFISLILVAYYAASYSGSSIFERFLNLEDAYSNNDSSVTGRLDIWREAISLIKSSPIVGGNFEANHIYPHNIFLESLMSTGIFPFLIFIFITFYGVVLSIQAYIRDKEYLPFVLLTHGVVMGLFSGSLYTSILYFVGLGLVISYFNYINRGSISF